MNARSRGFPLVIAAPSGAGKTSLARALIERREDAVFSTSVTTRARRPGEEDGCDYRFVDRTEFDRMAESGELVEWAVVHGHRYGTPRSGVEAAVRRGDAVVLDIDIQGARQIRSGFDDAVLIFVLPPTAEELNRRLTGRGSEDSGERRRRLGNARREIPAVREFDYVVVNNEFERAVRALESIVAAERHRVDRCSETDEELARLDRELREILERSTP